MRGWFGGEGLLPVVVKAVDSAMKRDSASGNSFDVAIINQKGYRALTDQQKKETPSLKIIGSAFSSFRLLRRMPLGEGLLL